MENSTQNMGEGTSPVFAGRGVTSASRLYYGESAEFFTSEIKKRLPSRKEPYTLLDIGTHEGELLANIIKLLPEYNFDTIGIDLNQKALNKNPTIKSKILCNAESLPFEDKSVDLAIARSVLQWNLPEAQKRILKEIARVIRRFAIVEHPGPKSDNAVMWREHSDRLFSGNEISKMKRSGHFFASEGELEKWMDENHIQYKNLRSRTIPDLSNIYIERYLLNKNEAKITRKILGDMDYLRQTEWLILPGKS